MTPKKMYVPNDISELLEFVVSMLSRAPAFKDRTGRFPYRNLDYVFRQLAEGLNHNRQRLGEHRYADLMRMSGEIRALFEVDPEDKTGETSQGCKIILRMEDILREALRKA
jgi:hypothetical protein